MVEALKWSWISLSSRGQGTPVPSKKFLNSLRILNSLSPIAWEALRRASRESDVNFEIKSRSRSSKVRDQGFGEWKDELGSTSGKTISNLHKEKGWDKKQIYGNKTTYTAQVNFKAFTGKKKSSQECSKVGVFHTHSTNYRVVKHLPA